MQYRINVGDAIPDFHGVDEEDYEMSSEDLLGTPFIIYFYPHDDTPNCTKEACSLRDNMQRLNNEDIMVIGVSPDSTESHRKFIEKYQLNFTLLSDESLEICKKFDVLQQTERQGKKVMGIQRTTFLVDRDGIVQWLERPVNVEGQIDRIMAALHLIK
jgi:thioredoxin-dependent peroxiredoxin